MREMKTCDVCKRNNRSRQVKTVEDLQVAEDYQYTDVPNIESVYIGTSIDVRHVQSLSPTSHESPVVCELCLDCIEKVNASIADHLREQFGLVIRK